MITDDAKYNDEAEAGIMVKVQKKENIIEKSLDKFKETTTVWISYPYFLVNGLFLVYILAQVTLVLHYHIDEVRSITSSLLCGPHFHRDCALFGCSI